MPAYDLVCDDCGAEKEVIASINAAPKSSRCICGGRMRRDFHAEHSTKRHAGGGFSEFVSEALGVHPDEIENTIAEDRKMGSMASEYLPDGRLKFSSLKQMRQYCRTRGFVDRKAFI